MAQVIIEVHAAAVNFPDLLMTCGGYQLLDLHRLALSTRTLKFRFRV